MRQNKKLKKSVAVAIDETDGESVKQVSRAAFNAEIPYH